MAKNFTKPSVPPQMMRRPALMRKMRNAMLSFIVRDRTVYQRAEAAGVTEATFTGADAWMGVVWTTLGRLYRKYEQQPTLEQMQAECENAIGEDDTVLDDADRVYLFKFLKWAYAIPAAQFEDPSRTRWALDVLRQYLEERLLLPELTRVVDSEAVPVDFASVINGFGERLSRITAINTMDTENQFPEEGFDEPPRITRSTGISFFDRMLDGGMADGEAYGLMAMIGTGKTLTGVQLAVSAARQFEAEESDRMVFYLTYEDGLREIRYRVLSNAARVPLSTIAASAPRFTGLATTPQSYEEQEFGEAAGVLSELDRVRQASRWLAKRLVIMDMTVAGYGGGGIAEVEAMIQTTLRERKMRCGLVVIDHVSAMTNRYITLNQLKDRSKETIISELCYDAKIRLATGLDTTLWLLHQFTGQANKTMNYRPLNYAHAKDCASFAEFTSFCFSYGKPTETNPRLCAVASTKHRRSGASPEEIIRIEGNMARVVSTDGAYSLRDGRIVAAGDGGNMEDERERMARLAGRFGRPTVEVDSSDFDV